VITLRYPHETCAPARLAGPALFWLSRGTPLGEREVPHLTVICPLLRHGQGRLCLCLQVNQARLSKASQLKSADLTLVISSLLSCVVCVGCIFKSSLMSFLAHPGLVSALFRGASGHECARCAT
jgi:hypothetical protein